MASLPSTPKQSDVLDANTNHKATSEDSNFSSCGDPNMSYENKPGEIFKNLHGQDVGRSKTTTQLGMLTEVAGDSEKDDEAGSTEEGEMTETTNDVGVINERFFHGDHVVAASDPSGQIGSVLDVNIIVDLLARDGSIKTDIPSRDLKRITEFEIWDYVISGSRLGIINYAFKNVTIQLDDGSVCEVMKANAATLYPVDKNERENENFPYYPGQRVQACSDVFKDSQWLSGSWKDNQLEGTVTKVTVGEVFINWIAHADEGPLSLIDIIKELPKDIKLLSCLAHTKWKLGDWCLLPSPKGSMKSDSHVSTEMGDDIKEEMATEEALVITNARTTVDVAWQDGVINHNLDSTSLIIVDTLGDHEFFAEQHVVEKHAETERFGIIKSVDAKDRTAHVRWLKPVAGEEEIMSVYDLKGHPDYEFRCGAVVVRKPDQMYSEHHKWVGNITNFKDGDVEVTWADGSISLVRPQAIYVPSEFYDGSDGSDGAVGLETNEDDMTEEIDWGTGKDEDMVGWGTGEDEDMVGWETGEDDMTEDHGIEDDSIETLCDFKPPVPNASATFQVLASVPLDHHFLGSQNQNNAAKKWIKKVQQDWVILQNNLPNDIYVHIYEDRMDLLRAVIIGAYGTPYQDGLFFFDFHLPPAYPDDPPSAYYHSRGWRLNPNLYEDGNICLSLLNTWEGKGKEVWDPSTSSILQVLVSLQGLVLNAKPYFNEATYDQEVGTVIGEKNSLTYNENVFILNCKMMIYLMRSPPKGFEQMVLSQFKRRAPYILKASNAYMSDCLIGSLDASANISSVTNSNSIGFKKALSKVLPDLVSAFSRLEH